jgi:acetyl esterase/lipase
MRARAKNGRFLAASALGALTTANGLKPFSRQGLGSLPALAFGVMPSEMPLHVLAGQAATAALAIRRGALRSPAGRVGLALTAGSAAGLIRLHRDALASGDVLEAALRDGLGPDYRESLHPHLAPDHDTRLTPRQISLPGPGARKRYLAAADLAYGDAGVRNQLDVWRRSDLPVDGRAPVLLQIHGGAWVFGRKDNQAGPLLSHLAERGWVCVAMNYRLAPKATWPDLIVDVKAAIAWIRASIAEHGGDPGFLAVTGGSAGGHLSALAALTAGDPEFQPGFEDADTTVQAAVPMYGLYDLASTEHGTRPDTIEFLQKQVMKTDPAVDRRQWEAASPLHRIHPDAPPFLVVHGTNDSFLPVEQARVFADRLRTVSTSPVAYAELPRAQHGFDFASSVRVHHVVRAVERFLTSVRVGSSADSASR